MTQSSKKDTYFLIHFRDPKDGKTAYLKAKRIEDSTLGLSFVRISDFIFELEGPIVQPTEEQMQKRLENVKSLHLSIYSIISIEEKGLNHEGLMFKKDKANLLVLPGSGEPRPVP